MNIGLFKKNGLLVKVISAYFLLMSVVMLPPRLAQGFGPKVHRKAFYPPPGFSVRALPGRYRHIHVDSVTYFFLDGVFYRHAFDGYVVVAAPIGAVVPSLPSAAVWITIGAMTYSTYAGVYYQKTPEGHMVVTPPVKPAQPDSSIAWEGDQIRVAVPILKVRSGPGTEHSLIKEVHQGDLLVVQSSSSDWYYVKLPDNSFGWVMVKFTTIVKPMGMG